MKQEADFLFNRKDTAAAFGVSTQSIGLWDLPQHKKEGAVGNRVYYDIREVIQYKMKHVINSGKSAPDAAREKNRLIKLQADKAQHELDKAEGKVVDVDIVKEHWEGVFLSFRAKILGIPQRAATVALNAASIPEVEEELEKFLLEALNELSGDGMPDEN